MTSKALLKQSNEFLCRRDDYDNFIFGLICSLIVCMADITTPPQYQFHLLYLFPIGLTSWYAGKKHGLVIAVLSSIYFGINQSNLCDESFASIWNTVSTSVLFVVASLLVSKVRKTWQRTGSPPG
ncbi:hypothetical protein [Geomesophilobacter sediminis]|uniref:Uncharacterized protein n=1 Tax=Geomesophilobacter sediminis TaxID=2798584 RepID=A0A8J7JE36_9BACT|nr:hypothetical protein [Geomesophilobacter sediminis]MBJ6724149.1 hypothetical protein [Geomesophilobacter sediminis]